MPDDNLYEGLVRLGQGRKVYRRKRKSRGADFSGQEPPTMQEINRGVWCKKCHKRHPYNGSKRIRLGTQYEKRGAHWVVMWLCPVYGDVVGTIYLGGK